MNIEKYNLRLSGRRILFVSSGDTTLLRIARQLEMLGAKTVGPSAWHIDSRIQIEQIMAAIGELADGEIIYILGTENDGAKCSLLIAPRSGGEIRVTSKSIAPDR